MLRYLALSFALLTPVHAMALSCMPWNMEDSFQRAAQSADPYVIAYGRLVFSKDDLPQVDWGNQQNVPPETRIDARLTGHGLDGSGFDVPFDHPVEIVVRCAGPWCPALAPGAPYLAFLKRTGSGYQMDVGACTVMGYAEPDTEMLEKVQRCFNGAACQPPE